ncbi:MAG: bacillithiol transferase BstA [Ekhidna sp.]
MDLETLRYPVGKYQPVEITNELFETWIDTIEQFPSQLKEQVSSLSFVELDLPYRPGGWTVKQVVHHLADSHINSFIRFKLVMTEDKPAIKPYQEAKWAELPDANNEDIVDSLSILEGLHKRWTTLLKNLTPEDKKRTFIHPEYNKELTLEWMLGLYDWHCRHHLAHINQAIEKNGAFVDAEKKP